LIDLLPERNGKFMQRKILIVGLPAAVFCREATHRSRDVGYSVERIVLDETTEDISRPKYAGLPRILPPSRVSRVNCSAPKQTARFADKPVARQPAELRLHLQSG
jgi:hypothetical protein